MKNIRKDYFSNEVIDQNLVIEECIILFVAVMNPFFIFHCHTTKQEARTLNPAIVLITVLVKTLLQRKNQYWTQLLSIHSEVV